MSEKQPTGADTQEAMRAQDWDRVAETLRGQHAADIADVINAAPRSVREKLFSLVEPDIRSDVLTDLETAPEAGILESLTDLEISDLMEEMAPDDAADVLGDLPDGRSEVVLDLMEEADSEDVRRLLTYDDDTAGGIMTTDLVAMSADQTVAEALQQIAYLDTNEQFYYANIVDGADRLIGYVNIWELLRERERQRPLGELVHKGAAAATVDMDQEEVVRLMSKYDLDAIPVTDAEGRLVGRITSDDVIDVMEEEASEDIVRLAGSHDAELESGSTLKSCVYRLPWLLITLLGGFATSLILKQFHAHIAHLLVLAYFVPILLAMGGNTGIQASTLTVRRIALGELKGRSARKLLFREILVGLVMGSVCAVIIGLWAHFMIHADPAMPALHLAAIVGTALFAAMTFATGFGALVPMLLDRVGIDPAVASGPFITTTNDISALLIYFAVTNLLIRTII